MAKPRVQLTCNDYGVGWICALDVELTAATAMLDERHASLDLPPSDQNHYIYGKIGTHNVVIAPLPAGSYGISPATRVATRMQSSFPNLEIRLMVGIGGGVPSPNADIRLGDIVVSEPGPDSNGVIQYDLGKTIQGKRWPERKYELDKPPERIRTALPLLKLQHKQASNHLSDLIDEAVSKNDWLGAAYLHPGADHDKLFDAEYSHKAHDTCDRCDISKTIQRPIRSNSNPQVFYGTIASGNQVVKDTVTRDYWQAKNNVICFEMEAAGLLDGFPCLVIRGICDYADSHKNKRWQPYAALTAAAYGKNLLDILRPQPQLDNKESQRRVQWVLKHLGFPLIQQREELIEDIYARTFEWLLRGTYEETQDIRGSGFIEWLRSSSTELFWISGKPGSGKSTLMKNIISNDRLRSNLRHWSGQDRLIIASFYFYDRGASALQKSQEGMLRSILLQICSQEPNLIQSVFPYIFASPEFAGDSQRLDEFEFTLIQLKNSFQLAIEAIRGQLKLYLHVDGLDEYSHASLLEEASIAPQVRFMSDTEAKSKSRGHTEIADLFIGAARSPDVKICVSSRLHQRFVDAFEGQPHLRLEDLTAHDIKIYVQGRFEQNPLVPRIFRDRASKAQDIVEKVVSKAMGVFLWVKLVVTNLVDGLHDRATIAQIEAQLDSMPSELGGPNGLFIKILQNVGLVYLPETTRLIDLVLHAVRPPSTMLLSFAENANSELDIRGPPVLMPETESSYRSQMMEERIRARTAGLLETIRVDKYDATFPQVQFMHQTVKDFFLDPVTLARLRNLTQYEQPHHAGLPLDRYLNSDSSLLFGSLQYLYYLIKMDECNETQTSLAWRTISDVLDYAKRLKLRVPVMTKKGLDGLDEIASQLFRHHLIETVLEHGSGSRARKVPIPVSHWVETSPLRILNMPLCPRDYFLAFALRHEFFDYVVAKIRETPELMHKSGPSLLYIAFELNPLRTTNSSSREWSDEQEHWFHFRVDEVRSSFYKVMGEMVFGSSSHSPPMVIATLLEYNSDPNHWWHPRESSNWRPTVWVNAISSYMTHTNLMFSGRDDMYGRYLPLKLDQSNSQWIENIELLLAWGAHMYKPIRVLKLENYHDPNLRGFYEHRIITKTLTHEKCSILAYSSLFFVASTLCNLAVERNRLMGLLADKGAKFVQGDILELIQKWDLTAAELAKFECCTVSIGEDGELVERPVDISSEIDRALDYRNWKQEEKGMDNLFEE